MLDVGEELAETVAVGLLDAAADREDLGLADEETVDVRVAAVLGVAAVDLDDLGLAVAEPLGDRVACSNRRRGHCD